ncbi:MAG: BACON domain-containing protein [Candidatus Hydrogenedentes bacterium]|nr:BACON domain-containing protein [Candidatus Hydrogenedentota bacterium]
MRGADHPNGSRVSVYVTLLAAAAVGLIGCPSLCCVLWVYPKALELDGTQTTATLNVSDLCESGGTLTWQATPGASWLSVNPASGDGPGAVEVEVTHPSTKDMSYGRNTSSIRFTSNCGTDVVPVTAWFWPLVTFAEFYDEMPGSGFKAGGLTFSWEALYDIEATPDGGYIACGWESLDAISIKDVLQSDAYLLKTDLFGERLWAINWGVAGNTSAQAVVVTSEGDYVVAGCEEIEDTGGAKGALEPGIYAQLTCVGPDGNIKWSKLYGEPGWIAWDVQQAPDGGFVLAGDNSWSGADDYDAFLIKTDADGNEEWAHLYPNDGDEYVWAVAVTPDNGYVLAGEAYSADLERAETRHRHAPNLLAADKNGSQADAMLLKTDENGTQRWLKTLGGDYGDCAHGVIVVPAESGADKDGAWQYAVCGESDSYGGGVYEVYLAVADMMGEEEWHETYSCGGPAVGLDLALTPDSGFIIAGGCNSGAAKTDKYIWASFMHESALLLQVDSDGSQEWMQTLRPGIIHALWAVTVAPDRGYAAAGYSMYIPDFIDVDAFIVKTDENGDIEP